MKQEIKYEIIQDTSDWDNPSGAYLVIDKTNDKVIAEFDFKLEAKEFIKQLKTIKL
jgi:hypothetical protein